MRKKRPKVSILTTTYARPWGLLAAMRCVQAQTFRDIEHVIVADHCPHADDVVRELRDDRTRYLNLERNANDLGVTPLNTALSLARGDWIAVLADDNLFAPDWVETLYEAAKDRPDVAFVYGCCEVRHKEGKMKDYPVFRDEPYPHWQGIDLGECLYRREVFDKYGPWEFLKDGGPNYSYDWAKIEEFLRGGEKWVHVPRAFGFVFYVVEEKKKRRWSKQKGGASQVEGGVQTQG